MQNNTTESNKVHGVAVPKVAAASGRLQYLDVLRGLAALVVTVGHVMETGLRDQWSHVLKIFNTGMFGVLLFFIISGLVITASIVKAESIKSFWVGRFWRLFPLYWASLIFSASLFLLFPDELKFEMYGRLADRFALTFVANMTMLQHFFKFDHFIGAYWTLSFEMLFYISLSIFAFFKKAEKAYIGVWLVSAYLMAAGLAGLLKGDHVGFFNVTFCGYFCLGIWTYRLSKEHITTKQYLTTVGIFATSLVFAWAVNSLHFGGAGNLEGHSSPWANLVAYLAAIGVFLGFHFKQVSRYPEVLHKLGLVSFSLYLAHALAIRIGARIFDPNTNSIPFIFSAFILTAILTFAGYKGIELPCLKKIQSLRKGTAKST